MESVPEFTALPSVNSLILGLFYFSEPLSPLKWGLQQGFEEILLSELSIVPGTARAGKSPSSPF